MSEEERASASGAEAAAPADAATRAPGAGAAAEETAPEQVTELAPPRETHRGDCPQVELDRLRPICANADQKYQQVLAHLRHIKDAEQVLQRFQAREGKLTPLDVEKAKEQFHKAKQSYLQAGNEINEGIKPLYELAQGYPEDLALQQIYRTYLAKLLASLQTRNPVEPFVELLAAGAFDFERRALELDEKEPRGLSREEKKQELLQSTARIVNMLETRYLKRQLQNRLRLGENLPAIVKRVSDLLKRDPEDLHTYIWLARLKLEHYEEERNQNRRVAIRDEILKICQKAFTLIDDFLSLQGIHDQNDRDRRRAGYVRSITAIRKPLMRA
jgi:hypothetical protein